MGKKKKVEIQKIYTLTPMQEGMLFHSLMDDSSNAYFEQTTFTLRGEPDMGLFEKSFNFLVKRYDILRTIFNYKKTKTPIQVVLKDRPVKVAFRDIRQTENASAEIYADLIEESRLKDRAKGFDLTRDALMRITVLQTADDTYNVLWSFHHILMDGWCLGIVMDDFFSIYESLRKGREPELGAYYPFGNYIKWLEKQDREEAARYWQSYLGGAEEEHGGRFSLFGSHPDHRAEDEAYRPIISDFTIDEELTSKMSELANRRNTTTNTIIQTAWGLLLQHYSRSNDVVFGSVVSGRSAKLEGIEKMVGLFINTIPVRVRKDRHKTFEQLMDLVQEEALASTRYDYFPLAEIQAGTSLKKDLLDHIIVFENYPMEQEIQQIGDVDKLGFVIDGVQLFEQTSYDLNIIVIPGNSLTVRMNYNAARYPNASFMERLTGHFKAILQQGVAKPGTKAEDIHILTDAEKEKILEQFNGIRDDSPQPETIHQWFLNQVQKTPEHTAVVHTEAGEDEESLTYEQLEERACRLAHALRERGVGADTIVGVMAGRSLDMITAMMGILLAGGAYLPIDPGFPESRIRYMITDSRIRQILTDLPKENLRFVPETVEILDIRKELTGSCKESGEMPAHINKNSDLLYMIYTSGSTGQPKGVMLEHRNLVNLLMHQYEHTLIDFSRVLQFTTISFDVSFQEIFSTLLSGGTLHLIKEETRKDVERLFGIVDTFDIKTLFLPVSFLKFVSGEDEYIQQMPDCVEHIVTAGEQVVINDRLRGCLKDNNIRLHNHYGPSETHVVTEIMLDPFGDLPTLPSIGKPVLNTGIYLLAPNMHPQPEGVPGELYIGGIQVGRGYMGRADETAKRFITNPFRSDEKLYRSGDLARWLPDGNIEFIGRVDFQVKIRGFRIELGEIEARLTRQENIKAAVVIARKDDTGGNYLCAYFTAEVELTVPQLRDFLLEDLPEYMLPSYFIQLETFPVTPTGKVDRRALPAPDGPVDTGIEYTPPRDEVEEKLVDIWQDILKVKRVGIDDDFFHLGGHSLKATMLTGRIFKELNVEFPLSRLFKSPTVRGIARFINGADENMYAAIEPAAQRHYYSLSTAQKRLYILDGFENKEPGAAVGYHIPAVLEIEGKVDADKFTQVFKTLVERHESLRTSFKLVEGQPVQEIHPKVNFSIEHLQITEKSASPTRKEQIESLLRPFDLSKAPLLRVGLISEGEERHILVVDMHHIVSDGTSIAVIVREFVDLYDGKELPPMRLQYKDYSVWQHETFKTGILKEQEVYWKKRLSGDIPVLEMPLDYPRPAEQSFEGAALYFALEADVTAKLKTFASERQVTLYMLLLAAYNVLLARYSGQDDILVGSPVAGRPHPDLENIVGMFVNTLVMRNFPHSEKTFSNFLAELKDNTLKVYENQDYPFESLVELLDLKRDLGRNPLFDTMFTLQNVDIPDIGVEGLTFTPIEYDNGSSTFDVSVTAVEVGNRLEFSIEYGTRLFAGETIERFGAHFTNALEFLLQDPDKPLADIDILTFEERKQVLYGFNDNYGDFDADTPLHRLFSQQVERTPDETAVVGPLGGEGSAYNRSLTYRQLEEKASQLARLLRDKGVGPDTIVGIMVERSVEMISGLFGILKAGGAYLPIDPSHPRDRIDYMLADSGAEVLLTSHSLAQNVTFEKEIFLLEEPEPGSEEGSGKSLSATQAMRAYTDEGSNLAYIIYTSGTTGKPKGVAVEHRNITAYIQAFLNICDLHGNDVIVSVASYSFDAFGEELYPMLFRGGTFVIPSKEEITDFNRLVNLMVEYKATVANASPLLMNQLSKFSRQLADIRYVIVGGDVARLDHVKNFLPQATVLNTYGPTETTICATYHKCGEKDPQALPIGQPYTNYMVYIVAGGERVLPVGVPGELCISGVGVARGYLNRPQLTAEKFIENPFVPQERLYRSGDLARWTPDGTIQFLGRIDNQVNIRGFRIELGEVEYRLQAYQNIDAAVVVPRDDEDGDKFLCGYYTTTDETVGQLPVGDLRDFLTLELPEYMVPAFFIYMESFPLSPTGKVNKRALPEPGGEITTGVPYAPPSGKVEETLVELWQDILKAETVGIDDNFFRLGGHSLKAAVLSGRIYKALSVEFPLSQIFNSPTVRQMAHYLQGVEETAYASIQPVEPSDNYPLSSSQKRVYALQQIEGRQSAVSYNIPDVLRISGRPDRELFTDIFRRLIKRHESLRTSFEMVGEKTVQIVHDSAQFDVEYYDVSKEEADDERTQRFRIQNGSLVPEGSPDEDDRETETNLLDEFIRPFDLSRAPLLRVGLIRETDDTHILALDMHHIISDGSSISTLVNEFVRLYLGETLPPLRIQYKDFAVWQKRLYEEGVMLKQEEFWKTQFEGDIPVMDMPTDFQRPQVQSFDGESISFTLNSHLTELLKELASLRHATLYMALSAVYNVLLSRYTGQQDIVVGCPVAGRPHPDLEQVVGMFINTLPIRYSPLEGTSFADFLEQAKDVTLRAFENQEFPFDELVETLDVRRDLSHNPLFDTMLVLQNFDTPGLTVGDLVFQPLDYDTGTSKLDMTLNAVEVEGELVFHLEYCTRLFHRERMERLGEHFINIVRSVVEKPTVLLKNIDILSEKEREQILVTFNDTAREYPENASVGDLFIEQAERNPEAIALVSVREPISGDREGTDSSHEPQPPVELSYRALDEESEALARVLQGRGVFAGDIVAVMTDRTVELIVGILAVLKVGAVYMPLQPDYPRERLRYFLADSNAKMLLTIKRLARFDFDLDTIYLEELPGADVSPGEPVRLVSPVKGNDLVYVIYTSGTTGIPKGVMVEHRGVVRLVRNTDFVEFREGDCILQTCSIVFDVTTFELWGALLNGLKLILVDKDTLLDVPKFKEALTVHRVTILFLTPALFNRFAEQDPGLFRDLSYLVVGGDVVSPPHAARVSAVCPEVKIVNGYGPTENTTFSTCFYVKDTYESAIPIGPPIANSTAYVMDKHGRLQPIGIPGELWVGGEGVARGYMNRPELTREKFLSCNISSTGPGGTDLSSESKRGAEGQILYRTGDLTKWLPNGCIDFLGRIDHQVKIRGFRIEMGEIETQLLEHPGVKEAVVVDRKDERDDKYLCVYVVPEHEFTIRELQEHLARRLPDYMIPSVYVRMETFPLNANGKVDRKNLPAPETEDRLLTGAEYEAPCDDIEEKMALAWTEVLGVNQAGVHDNFFSRGGDSIRAIQLSGRMRAFGLKIEVKDLFRKPTIRQLRPLVARLERKAFQGIVEGTVPLTPIQHWFFQREETLHHHWNQSFMLFRKEGFDEDALNKVLEKWLEHHDALRMTYTPEHGHYSQQNRGMDNQTLLLFKTFDMPESDVEVFMEAKGLEIQTGLNVIDGPAVGVGLFKSSAGHHLLIAIHHLVVDGISWRILLEDFSTGYQQAVDGAEVVFPEKTDSFKEWSERLQVYAAGRALLRQKDYWRNLDLTAVPPLPEERHVYYDLLSEAKTLTVKLDQKTTGQLLKEAGQAYNTEINHLLLTALGLALQQWTENSRFAVNLEGHGREQIMDDIDVSRTVGWFTSAFPVILDIPDPDDLSHCIRLTKENLNRIPEKGVGYGILQSITPDDKKEGFAFSLKPRISFNYLGQTGQDVKEGLFSMSPYSGGEMITPESKRDYVLDINGIVTDGRLEMGFNFNKEQYSENTIHTLAGNFNRHLIKIIHHCLLQTVVVRTPSDFDRFDLTLQEFDQLADALIYPGQPENKMEIAALYPLTPMQSGMLFHHLMDTESVAYFEQSAFTLHGTLDLPLFQKSFNLLVERYDILRTVFLHGNLKTPLQVVLSKREVELFFRDLTQMDAVKKTAFVNQFGEKDKQRGFVLHEDVMMRISILQTAGQSFKVFWSFHHILMDGWCLGILMEEFFKIYTSLKNDGEAPQLPEVYAYGDYIRWLEKQDMEEAGSYWKKMLEGSEAGGRISAFAVPPEKRELEFIPEHTSFQVPEALTQRLQALSTHTNVTVNTLFQALWGIVLHRYSHIDDIVFGSVVSGRSARLEGIEKMVGLFINTIPVHIRCSDHESFLQLIKTLQENSLASAQYEYYPLARIQSDSPMGQDLLDHIMVFENYPMEKEIEQIGDGNLGFSIGEVDFFEQTNYDFSFTIFPGDTLTVQWNYNEAAYPDGEFFNRMSRHFMTLLEACINEPRIQLGRVDMLTKSEKEQMLVTFNDSACDYPKEKKLHQLFRECAERTPDAVALEGPVLSASFLSTKIDGVETVEPADSQEQEENRPAISLTYSALNHYTDQLAKQLVAHRIGCDSIAAVMLEQSCEAIISLLAILKAGGAYLPISPKYPEERINFILRDSEAEVLLTIGDFAGKADFNGKFLLLDSRDVLKTETQQTTDAEKLAVMDGTPDSTSNLAYVLYTSGTTGNPKGVLVEHGNAVNQITAMICAHGYTQNLNHVLVASFTFDASVVSLFSPLLSCGRLVLPGENRIHGEPRKLWEFISRRHIHVLLSVPGFVGALLENLPQDLPMQLNWMLLGGDALPPRLVEALRKQLPGMEHLINIYGPTETTVIAVQYKCGKHEPDGSVPIGTPVANYTAYILDPALNPVPFGVNGELCVGGDSVARGYLNRPELTHEKFIENPCLPGQVLYKTGDLCSWREDGNIMFTGRVDHQVKIRGFRIELGEIEAYLCRYPSVMEAVVIAHENASGVKSLYAYITPARQEIPAIVEFLADQLPGYMVPARIIALENFHKTPAGKINRKLLPDPGEKSTSQTPAAPPADEIEGIMVQVWTEVLGFSVDVNDDFFACGGDSIKAIQLVGRLQKYQLKMEIKDLFKHPSIRDLRPLVVLSRRRAFQGIVTGDIPLTPIQHWFFQQQKDQISHWNQAVMLFASDGFDEAITRRVLARLVHHHDALRIHYAPQNDPVLQVNRGMEDDDGTSPGVAGPLFTFQLKDYRQEPDAGARIEAEANEHQKELDLEKGPLFNIVLFKTAEGDHLLFIIHHVVVDVISWRILVEDFQTGYSMALDGQSPGFQDKTDSFKDWAEKQRDFAHGKKLLRELEYWKAIEQADIPALPMDRKAVSNRAKDSLSCSITLSAEETRSLLTEAGAAYHTEINDLLLTALGLAFKQWTGNDKILIQLEGHGREPFVEDIDISRTIGWFTCTFPVLLDMTASEDISYQLRFIKETLRRVPNKGIGYGMLQYLTPLENTGGFQAPGEILFNYIGETGPASTGGKDSAEDSVLFEISPLAGGDVFSPESHRTNTFSINGLIVDGRLEVGFEYNKMEYDESTVQNIADLFRQNLQEIISHCKDRLENPALGVLFTPSDYGSTDLSLPELENLQGLLHRNLGKEAQIKEIYPLTPMQEGMLFHTLMDDGSNAYFEQTSFTVEGELDPELFQQAFNQLLERYDILRTAFYHKDTTKPLQVVLEERFSQIHLEDISEEPEESKPQLIAAFRQKDKDRGFSLDIGRSVRISIQKTHQARYQILWSFHHILMDGWCLGILMGDFFKIYKGLRTDTPEELGSYHPYGDYIRWLEKQDRSEAGEYWSNYLEGLELEQGGRITDFGTKVAEGTKQSYTAAKKIFTIEEESTTQMHAFCNSVNITMNTLFQSLWGLLLQRYSRTPDVVFGSVVSGRSANIPGIEQMVGLFINTIPIRIRTDIPPQLPSDSNVRESSEQISTETAVHTKAFGSAEPFSQKGTPAPRGGFWPPEASTFLQLVKRVQESALQSGVYDYYPLTEIQAAVPHRGDLMDHFLVFENYPIGKEILDMSEKEDLGFEMVDSHSFDQAGYDFDFVVLPGKQLEVSWNYNADVFTDPGFMDRMAGHFVRMLHQCMDEPAVAVNQIDILTPGEKWQIIDQFNDTKMEYRTEMLLHQIVEAQVARRQLTSESPMLGGNTQSPAVQGPHLITRTQIALSYEELNARALELTRELIEKGFDTGHIAAVMLDRSVEMIIALFAVLKAGGAYLPIDPQAPAARIAHMLEDSRAPFLLTWTKAPQEIPFDGTIVHVDKTESALLGPVESREAGDSFEPGILPLSRPIQPEDAAYIIYTSGTTGKPKGVVVEHRNAVAYVRAFLREFQLTEKDILLQQASYTFDAFVEEIYPILSIGGRVIVNSKEDIQEVKNFARLLETHKATIISCSPLLLSQLNRYAPQLQSLRIAISGGDVLRGDYIDNLLPICDVYNTYGPTEGTVCATYHKCTPEDGRSIPIGRPIGGYHVYILDDNLKMLPIGIPGELCIAGPGVARGYLRQPDLTAEKFVENPLAAGERMYRSGDLARWNPDGTIRFLGRIDRQVNVRGFRVEMEAIESLLAQHPAMYETAVIDREDADGAKYLCAYIVPVDEDDQSVTTAALKEYLGETLPEYMIPSFFIPLQSIPLGTTGKLDRKALPAPDSRAAAGVEFAEAKDEIESTLVSIYRQVLGLEQVGVEDNFFDIGGHSIKAIQVTNLIHKELGSEVGLTGIFQNPTIAELAQVVRDKQGGGFAGIEPVEPRENYELSYAQKRLWVLQRIEAESSAYNMPEHLPIHEAVDVPILEQVIQDIVKRHESLRTRFTHIEGEPVQIIDPENHIKLETPDISHLEGDAQETQMAAIYEQEFSKPFDLEEGPLLRVKLIKYSDDRYDFLFTMHHIVSDGWSMDVLKREFHQLYDAYRKKEDFQLEPMKIQYKDFAAWQNALFADAVKMQAAKDFWKDQLSRQLPILNLPRESTYSESHREGEASAGAVYRIVVPGETSEKLKQLAGEYNASLFMVLLSGFNLFLSNLTGNDEIMVSMAGAGREHEDLKNLVGFFINTLVVKNYVDNSETYIELLKRVQSNTLKVLDYQNYPLELIVDELKLKYPKVSVFLNMLNIGEANLQTLEDTAPYHEEQSQDTKFDMTCYLTEYANGIEVVCNYLPIAFKAETIEYIMGEFVKVLGRIAEDPNKTPKEYTASPKRRKLKRIRK